MKLWSFLFPDPAHPLQSARVAAPSKGWANALLSDHPIQDARGDDQPIPADDAAICIGAGEGSYDIGVQRVVYKGGKVVEAS